MVITILNAKTDLGPVGKGGSGSHYCLCEDGNEYVVKFSDIYKTSINELIAGLIATKMNLPSPDVVIINLPEFMILESTEDIKDRKIQLGFI